MKIQSLSLDTKRVKRTDQHLYIQSKPPKKSYVNSTRQEVIVIHRDYTTQNKTRHIKTKTKISRQHNINWIQYY